MNTDVLGGRRFILAVGLVMLTTLLTWFGKITGEVYSAVTITTITGLIIGNTTEQVKKLTVGAANATVVTTDVQASS
jgi:hypothetical protein